MTKYDLDHPNAQLFVQDAESIYKFMQQEIYALCEGYFDDPSNHEVVGKAYKVVMEHLRQSK